MLIFKLVILKLFLILNLVFINISFADNHNIYETLEIIKNGLANDHSKSQIENS